MTPLLRTVLFSLSAGFCAGSASAEPFAAQGPAFGDFVVSEIWIPSADPSVAFRAQGRPLFAGPLSGGPGATGAEEPLLARAWEARVFDQRGTPSHAVNPIVQQPISGPVVGPIQPPTWPSIPPEKH